MLKTNTLYVTNIFLKQQDILEAITKDHKTSASHLKKKIAIPTATVSLSLEWQ